MKKKIVIGIICMTGGVFLSVNAFGQVAADPGNVSATILDPDFFVAILAGVLIALGFQMVLTNLSVAAGITAVGNLNKKDEGGNPETREEDHPEKNKRKSLPLGVILTSAAGGWTMLTAVISLFFASLFAVKLSLVADNAIGITLGLVIWAVFTMTMIYLESKAVGSMITGLFGSAIRAVKAGISAGTSGFGAIFRKSETAKMKNVAENTIARIRDEVYEFADASDIKNQLKKLVNKMEPHPLDMDKVKDELAALINEISIEQKEGAHPGEKELFLKVAEKQPHISRHEVNKLGKLFETARSAMKVAGILGITGGAAGMANSVYNRQKLGNIKVEVENSLLKVPYLRPEVVHAELDEIFRNETNADHLHTHHGSGNIFDKEYVAAVVAGQKNVTREEALMTAYKVEEAINDILKKSKISEMAGSKAGEIKDKIMDTVLSKKDEVVAGIEAKIEAFFNRLERPEFDYHLLKSEFEFILHNPKLAPEVLKRKIKQLDKDSIIALFSSSDKHSKRDLKGIVQKYEEAKLNVTNKLDNLEAETKVRLQQAKEFALEQAENTRKTAASASWWLFATFVLSGIAAALGGMAAL